MQKFKFYSCCEVIAKNCSIKNCDIKYTFKRMTLRVTMSEMVKYKDSVFLKRPKSGTVVQGRRNVWGHKDWSSPCFQDSVNPISTRGADYAHYSTTVLTMLKYVPAALKAVGIEGPNEGFIFHFTKIFEHIFTTNYPPTINRFRFKRQMISYVIKISLTFFALKI